MGESQPTLEMGPCLARHPQFGAYFRNCFKNLLLEHRDPSSVTRPEGWAATPPTEADLLSAPRRRRDRRPRPSPSL